MHQLLIHLKREMTSLLQRVKQQEQPEQKDGSADNAVSYLPTRPAIETYWITRPVRFAAAGRW
jgi:hypothetical protein